jgi:hypothetical protein
MKKLLQDKLCGLRAAVIIVVCGPVLVLTIVVISLLVFFHQ